jgi:very-short-patch-repair endonuclease
MDQNRTDSQLKQPATVDKERLKRLLSYYLECLKKDHSTEVSFFANETRQQNWISVSSGDELSSLAPEELPKRLAESKELGDFLAGRGSMARQSYYYGYPIFVNVGSARGTGRRFTKVEPLFYRQLEPAKAGSLGLWAWAEAPAEINPAVLKALAPTAEEARELQEALGLGELETAALSLAELSARVTAELGSEIWREGNGIGPLFSGSQLGDASEGGLYHQAMLFTTEPNSYTQGLEKELRALLDAPALCNGSALASLVGGARVGNPEDDAPFSYAVPLNTQQAAAVRSALGQPLTVITGPPGTGKSQVVAAIIVNAALRGQSVLFASRNHKAVEVVFERANRLTDRPLILNLVNDPGGQNPLTAHISNLLAQAPDAQSVAARQEAAEAVAGLERRRKDLLGAIQRLETKLAVVDRCEQAVEGQREVLGVSVETVLKALRDSPKGALESVHRRLRRLQSLGALPLGRRLLAMGRPLWRLWLQEPSRKAASLALAVGVVLPEPGQLDQEAVARTVDRLVVLLPALEAVAAYGAALDALAMEENLESMQVALVAVDGELVVKGLDYLKLWSHCLADGMSSVERQALSGYLAGLRTQAAGRIPKDAYIRLMRDMDAAFKTVSKFVPAWSVTNLSARGRIPFSPALFDLVVIDEASQCDIPSALPLLFRAKRAVIIGDPNQLQHITQLRPAKDLEMRGRYGLDSLENAPFGYATNSLFDLAQGVVQQGGVVELVEHHRSHQSIVEFSNLHFYQGRLKVVTDYRRLKPDQGFSGLRWVDIQGRAIRPSAGGAINEAEAKAVAAQVIALIKERNYPGSVGVTTPFRLQANRIREILNQALSPAEIESHSLIVDVVHKFQGDERDCMFFSPVVSEGVHRKSLGFLNSNGSLFNVAVTRARSLLIVVGDRERCATCGVPYLEKFAAYALQESQAQAADPGLEPPFESLWERVLYERLRAEGLKPMAQYQEGPYRLDLALLSGNLKLDIEVDGERYHRDWNGNLMDRDLVRNQRLQERGWQVLRFWVYQVRDDLDGCVDKVRGALQGQGQLVGR